jgi:hypothetical protein
MVGVAVRSLVVAFALACLAVPSAYGHLVHDDDAAATPPRPPVTNVPAPGGGGATLTIGGRIIDSGGRGIAGVMVALAGARTAAAVTDAAGSYSFSGLPAGDYTVTPARVGRSFTPASRALTGVAADAVADFLGADGAPPTLELPVSVLADATSPAGAAVTFDVAAHDEVDPAPSLSCTPASGTTFPIGLTRVRCSATDAAGNAAIAEFTVEVRGAQQQTGAVGTELAETVTTNPASPTSDKAEDALAKAQTALAELAKPSPDRQAALGAIEGAVGDLQAGVKDGLLPAAATEAQIQTLVGAARLLALAALEEATARGGDPKTLGEARGSLAEGDARRAAGEPKDAVNKYKDALAKAESA